MTSEKLREIEAGLDIVINHLHLELPASINYFSTPMEKVREKTRLLARFFGVVERDLQKDAKIFRQIRKLLRQNNETAAMELYQSHANLTAEETALAIESIKRGHRRLFQVSPALISQEPVNEAARTWAQEIVDTIKKSGTLATIIIYRKHTGANIKNSKDAVEAIMYVTGNPLL